MVASARMSDTPEHFLAEHPELLDEDRTSALAQQVVAALTAPLSAYHRVSSSGWQHVPAGGCLVVANHNIHAVGEIFLLLREWTRHLGARPARGLMHRIAWQAPFKWFPLLQWIGGIFAHPEVARRALARRDALLVFPGGDVQALRPFRDRYRIDFYGRMGFVRLARDAGVPIVPVVICGAHATHIMLPGGEWLARKLGLKRSLGVRSFPLTVGAIGAAVGVAGGLLSPLLWPAAGLSLASATVALPSRIDIEVLPPLLVADGESDEAATARVRDVMQASMDRLAARRRTPWF